VPSECMSYLHAMARYLSTFIPLLCMSSEYERLPGLPSADGRCAPLCLVAAEAVLIELAVADRCELVIAAAEVEG